MFGSLESEESNAVHLKLAADWILESQKVNKDGGSASHFDIYGWRASFPETTGYIIPSLIDYSRYANAPLYFEKAKIMGEFLLKVQLENGAFQGGSMEAKEIVPTVFNTGQVIFGLVRLYKETNDNRFLESAKKAGNWLCEMQETDGSWIKGLSPNADPIPHTYNVRAAWALLKLNEIVPDVKYVNCNAKNVEWSISQQNKYGWFKLNSFWEDKDPFTHTIAYTMRGILESGIAQKNEVWIQAIKYSADQLKGHIKENGSFANRLGPNWESKDKSTCLTGNSQLAIIYGKLYELFGNVEYLSLLKKINSFQKRTQYNTGNSKIKGGIKGSYPIYGDYCPYSYPNWAAKFFIDALLLEEKLIS